MLVSLPKGRTASNVTYIDKTITFQMVAEQELRCAFVMSINKQRAQVHNNEAN